MGSGEQADQDGLEAVGRDGYPKEMMVAGKAAAKVADRV
jgi:hypothetical protein